jgi:hypothetical protein
LLKRDLGITIEVEEVFDKSSIETLAKVCDDKINENHLINYFDRTDDAYLEEIEF